MPSNTKTVHQMLIMAKVQLGELVYDLGCGDGRILIMAACQFGARAVGIEIDPLRYLWSQIRIRCLGLQRKVSIKYGNFYKYNLSQADVIICYLLQDTNKKIAKKLNRELKPSARVVSNTFTFPTLSLLRKNKEFEIFVYKKKNSH
ncbi:MAG: class I SAM-dependent methyltransferase [Dehalococcoidia bacterium]|nr:MAG: class I SAM-dependent methyltransferase [Dehalococcoidia bacterium]